MISVDADADKRAGRLASLARRELHGDSALSEQASFALLERRMQAGARKPAWMRPAVPIALGAALTAACLVLLMVRAPSRAITFELAGGVRSADGRVVGAEATTIRFSDGSAAALERGAEARIARLTEHGGELVLGGGKMHVRIAEKPNAAWTVAAGPYAVRVTGTAFDVSWSAQAQTLDLELNRGAVIVTGPLALGGIPLRAGQRLFVAVKEGRLTVEGGAPAQALSVTRALPVPEPAPESEAEPANVGSARRAAPNAAAPAAPSSGQKSHPWTQQVAQGNFEAVVEQAERRGVEQTLASGSLEQLTALADAARYAGRTQLARRVLLAERQRFPSSAPARDAAFFLGRLAEDGGSGAIEWYDRYMAESPRGPYASQALGRKMMLIHQQRGALHARPIAGEYLSRYPNGPYAAAARKIDQESAAATKP
jgi:ferric-dicitrate binding protein FerR (iron transport regulator)